MMRGGNRFLDFANEIMARHRGLGFGFEPAAMLHLEDTQTESAEQPLQQHNFTTNLYHIQNITEENYLFKQNLNFLTQILENKMYQKLYPSVEKQIEKVIREEMPQAETKIIHSVSEQLYKLVQQGGMEQFELVREKVLSEYKETEKITLKEQEKLFRRIENIWNSSIYPLNVSKNYALLEENHINIKNNDQMIVNRNYPANYQHLLSQKINNEYYQQQNHQIFHTEIIHPEVTHTKEIDFNNTETEKIISEISESQKLDQKVINQEFIKREFINQEVINREKKKESVLERTLKHVEKQKQLLGKHSLKSIHLEYPSEENIQIHQEIMELLHSEVIKIPEIPEIANLNKNTNVNANINTNVNTNINTNTESSRTHVINKTRMISEQILSRMESLGFVSQNSPEKTAVRTAVSNQLSYAILEHVDSKITSEELQNNMLRILEKYQTEMFRIPGTDNLQTMEHLDTEIIMRDRSDTKVFTVENLKHSNRKQVIRANVNQPAALEFVQTMEPAPIVYKSEENDQSEQQQKTKQLEVQVDEVVKTLKIVEEKTVVQKERTIEEQRNVVKEVLKNNPTIWTEGESAGYIRNEIQQSVEDQLNQNVNQIVNKVYRQLENKLKSERGRRGLI